MSLATTRSASVKELPQYLVVVNLKLVGSCVKCASSSWDASKVTKMRIKSKRLCLTGL